MVDQAFGFPEIQAVLERLRADARSVLGPRFVGLYLHGSLAYGDFDPRTSDIDFLVVTKESLPVEIFSRLKNRHNRLFESGMAWSQKLEGAYIPMDALRRHDPKAMPVPWLGSDGHFALEGLGSDWIIQRWILREKGVAVEGPSLRLMIDPISAEDLREAVRNSLREWWSPPFPSPERFESDDYRAYAVLTMCRSLYVLEFGRIASKTEAARWLIRTLDQPWSGLAGRAVERRNGAPFDGMEEVGKFIRFTLNKAGILPG